MDDSTDKLAIEAVLDAVAQAHLARDAGAIVAAYEPDAMIFDLAPPLRPSRHAAGSGRNLAANLGWADPHRSARR
jgi:ketosteroid isomerase-like protein